jgi:hypothetical protein
MPKDVTPGKPTTRRCAAVPMGTTPSLIDTPQNQPRPFTRKKQPRAPPIGHNSVSDC